MRTITTTVDVYKFEELSDAAKERAVEHIQEKLNGPWWSDSDNEQLSAEIVYKFAQTLGTPGHDEFGEDDFPGISRVTLEEWDLERGQMVKFVGTLTRENAPALPWTAGIDTVEINGPYGSRIDVLVERYQPAETVTAMKEAIDAAFDAAWKAGRAQLEYLSSTEHAQDWIDDNDPEFTVNGKLYFAGAQTHG